MKQGEASEETVYIGDNSKVVAIVEDWPYPDGVDYDSISIQSETEPYELTVFLTGDGSEVEELEITADEPLIKFQL